MPEDTKAGMIQAYLDKYTGSMVCSKQLYKEALNHAFDEPKQWEIREINELMNQCISGWRYFQNPRMFSEYGRQKGWERENPVSYTHLPKFSMTDLDGFMAWKDRKTDKSIYEDNKDFIVSLANLLYKIESVSYTHLIGCSGICRILSGLSLIISMTV